MRSASQKLIKLLDENTFTFADLFTITLINGKKIRYTNFGHPLIVDGFVYDSHGLIIERAEISVSVGISVDNLDLKIYSTEFEIDNKSLPTAFRSGTFDGATLKLERVFLPATNLTDTSAGTITLFEGYLVEPSIDGMRVDISVVSINDQLAIKMPKNLYQPSCQNSLFDSACGLLKSKFKESYECEQGSSSSMIVTQIQRPQGWFTQGVIEFTSGANKGLKRTIRLHNSSGLLMTLPLDFSVKVGDTFDIYPGCDKRTDTCKNRFDNIINFKGTPYIPVPETTA